VVVGLTVLLSSLVGCTGSTAVPVPTVAATSTAPPVQPTSTITATPSLAPPNVIGMGVDQASGRIQDAQCSVSAEHIVNEPGTHVGQVVAQKVVSAYCEVALTVSAGPPPSSLATCHSLAVHEGRNGVGMGNFGATLIFRNIGPAPCTLQGYPDLTAREQGSSKTITARHTPLGYMGGTNEPVPTYVLLTGDSVSVLYEETDNPTGGQTTCPRLGDYRITAGGRTTTLPVTGLNCSGIEIHPYVPGTSGSAP